MLLKFHADVKLPNFDVCVVGAGPVGIALALACEANGQSVLLIESGGLKPNSLSEELSRAEIATPQHHVPMKEATCRAVGGTSLMWGRCCVPYDGVDFTTRLHAGGTAWPIPHDELSRWYPAAAQFFQCGEAEFGSYNSAWPSLRGVASNELARWARERSVLAEHRDRLARSKAITVLYDATVTAFAFSDGEVRLEQITVGNTNTQTTIRLDICVLACGGCETTRLLLAAQRSRPDILGKPGGPLGRNYMGHLSGTIADLVLNDPRQASMFDFFRFGGGYARRRFTFPAEVQMAEKLLNIALWTENSTLDDATYQNGAFSLIWIVLRFRLFGALLGIQDARTGQGHFEVRGFTISPFRTHLRNVVEAPVHSSANLAKIVWNRYFRRHRKPTPLVPNKSGRYPLYYMAEQVPNEQSRVWLSETSDALGLPRLCIDLRFSDADADSVVRSHRLLDAALRRAQIGRLDYRVAVDQHLEQVLAQARDGFHQIGTTRMGLSADSSVVDRNCRVHGVKNLYVASSSVFPSGGQANPTFMAVAMALRLAHHLGELFYGRTASAAFASLICPLSS
jgi:hypothetical protein